MDSPDYLRFIVALLFVCALVLLVGWVVRRYGVEQRFMNASKDKARLHIVERLIVDPKRRLMLVRIDNREHLVLLGMQQDILIESREASDA